METPDPTPARTPVLPASSSIQHLLHADLPEMDFVLPGLLSGTVGAVIGPGGVGKSFWSMQVAISMATGVDLVGLKPACGSVLYLSGEDPERVHAQRLRDIISCAPCNVNLEALDLRVLPGQLNIMDQQAFEEVLSAAKGTRLVVLDTLTRFHLLDENNSGDMKLLIGQLEQLAKLSGAAVIYLHHTSKAAVTGGYGAAQQAARGSSVLTDNARWSCFVATMTEVEARTFQVPVEKRERYVRWNINKQNYGASRPDVWFQRNACGVLVTHSDFAKIRVPFDELPRLPTDRGGRPLTHVVARRTSAQKPPVEPSAESILMTGITSQSSNAEREAHAAALAEANSQLSSARGAFDSKW